MLEKKDIKICFFGTGPLAESALMTLIDGGCTPKLLITKPDSKQGKSKDLLPPNIVHIAKLYNINIFQPSSLKKISEEEFNNLVESDFDISIVASYGNIIPVKILDIPAFGTINIHPSLLPKYRGPTPIESALLNNEEVLGISIMFLDEQVDHGPLLIQKEFSDFKEFPDYTVEQFERLAGDKGAQILLEEVLMELMIGGIQALEQDESEATYTRKLTKEDGLVDLEIDSIEKTFSIYRACTPWPSCYFMCLHNDKKLRVKISKMSVGNDGTIDIEKVIPEGKREMDYQSFKRSYIK